MKKLLTYFLLLAPITLLGQSINWISFSELENKMREDPKPVMVFIHADWCKYCKMQKEETFKDEAICNSLNNEYYCIQLNSELEENIDFLNRTYHFIPSGNGTGTHELAQFLGSNSGELVLPTTVFLNEKFELIQRIQNMIDISTMSLILNKKK